MQTPEDIARRIAGDQNRVAKRGTKGWWNFPCPMHDDKSPSAGINVGDEVPYVVKCHVCDSQQLFDFLLDAGYIPRLEQETKPEQKCWFTPDQADVTYNYCDEDGQVLYQKIRIHHCHDGKKHVLFWNPYAKKHGKGTERSVLYNLPAVLANIQSKKVIFLVEGEKCADALNKLGLVATTAHAGGRHWAKEYTQSLKGGRVVMLPDADAVGLAWSRHIRPQLEEVAEKVVVLKLPGLTAKEDVYDWLHKYNYTRDDLLALVKEKWQEPDIKIKPVELPEGCFPNTDLANAYRIAETYGHVITYTPQVEEKYMVYNGKHWEPNEGLARSYAQNIGNIIQIAEVPKAADRRTQQHLETWAKKSQESARISAALKESQTMLRKNLDAFDPAPNYFNCSNGVLDLETGDLIPHSQTREQWHTQISPVVYDPKALAPTWHEFLKSSIDDENTIKCLQMWCGYILSGYNDLEKALYLLGEANRGKSTFAGTIYRILGDYACSMRSRAWTLTRYHKQEDSLIALRGKRFCWVDEVQENDILDESQFKTVVSGEPVSARYLYANTCTFTPTAKLLFHGNYRMQTSLNQSIWRRLHIIAFDRQPETVKNYKARMQGEDSGILNWMAEGYKMLKGNGWHIAASEAMHDAAREYRYSQDVIQDLLDNKCSLGPGGFMPHAVLWREFYSYLSVGARHGWCSQKLGREMAKRGYVSRKQGGVRGYDGITLIEESNYAQKGFNRNAAGNAGTSRPDRKSGAPHPF